MIYIIGHKNPDTDSVISAIAYAKYRGEDYTPAISSEINNETKFILEKFNVEKPILLESIKEEDFVVLVDHNENTQIKECIKSEQIIEILDHHKVNVSFGSPISILTKPYGSTASLVTEKFLENNKEIDKITASLLLSAILSDTIIFKSPTTTEKDKEFAKILSEISGIDNLIEFGMELFKKKAELSSKSAGEIINDDFKDFNFGDKKIGITQVQLIDAGELLPRKEEMIAEMENIKNIGGYFSVIMIITDIMKEGSYFFVSGNQDVFYKMFNINEVDNYVQGVLSRKKQVIPVLEKELK